MKVDLSCRNSQLHAESSQIKQEIRAGNGTQERWYVIRTFGAYRAARTRMKESFKAGWDDTAPVSTTNMASPSAIPDIVASTETQPRDSSWDLKPVKAPILRHPF